VAVAGGGRRGRAGRPLKPLDGSASAQAFLGAELRQLRLERGLVLADLGRRTGYSAQHIGAVERGTSPASEQFIEACDAALAADGLLSSHFTAAVRAQAAARRQRHVARRALPSRPPHPPHSSQDDEPAPDIDWELIEDSTRSRFRRSPQLVEQLWLVTDRHRSLYHLLPAAQMIGPAEAHLATLSSLLLSGDDGTGRPQLAAMAQETAGLVAWLRTDLGDAHASDAAYRVADSLLPLSGDRALAGYVTAFRATVCADRGQYRAGAEYLSVATDQFGRNAPPMSAAWLQALRAEAAARAGDRPAVTAMLRGAERSLDRAGEDTGADWMYLFDHGRLAAHRGTCLLALGQPGGAEAAFTEAVASLPPRCIRRRADLRLKLAATHLARGDHAAAMTFALDALEGFVEAGSPQGLRSVRQLRTRVLRVAGSAAIAGLDQRLRELAASVPDRCDQRQRELADSTPDRDLR
jgi:transcriptional regulator with XRE-family HTH domain